MPDGIKMNPNNQAQKDQSSSNIMPAPEPLSEAVNATLVLRLVDSGDIINLGEKKELTIGRASDGQETIPDVDLTPYDAYAAGVSRLHIILNIDQSNITVQDFDSANGTRLNGLRIKPKTKHKLKQGDILTLGTLKVQLNIQE